MVKTKPEVASISPCFIVRDLAGMIAFYRDCLGFHVTYSAPDPDPFFAIVARDSIMIFLKEITEEVGPIPNSHRHEWARWDAYAYTPDPDGLAEEFNRLSEREIATPKDTEDGLRGFEIIDPNGYVILFGRPRG